MSTNIIPSVEDSRGEQPLPRSSAVLRYARRHPVSSVLSAVVLATGVGFGTFWGQFPGELAAGVVTTGQLAYWWTPITALLIPDSLIDGIITVVLILTVMAYTERLLGVARTLTAFLGTGILAILAGVGLEALAFTWGELWAETTITSLVLDPSIGVVGVIMAGSALAPALFRRRIRVVGFAILVMFALYGGDADSVYRLIAGALGLCLGLVFSRGASTGTWHRSSFRETRTLVAAIVAVSGIGPLVVLFSGIGDGPLALVVSGFAPVDPDEIFARCGTDYSAACDAQIGLALTAGAGPFLLSLVPLVLSVVAAWGLRSGRRAAWILGILVSAATATLTATTLGIGQLLDNNTAAVIGGELSAWFVIAVLIPIGVIVLLVITRRRFLVRAPRRAATRFAVAVVGAAVALSVVYVAVGSATQVDYLVPVGFAGLIADTPRLFVPPGFLAGIPPLGVPTTGPALVAFQWIGVLFWIIFVVAIVLLYRSTSIGRDTTAEQHFRALLQAGGGGTLGFMGTWPGNDYWFTSAGDGAVAYRVINGVALTMSDPVCRTADAGAVVRGFVDYCDAQGWAPVFYSFHQQYLPIFQEFGWQFMSVGEETVLPLHDLDMAGKPWQKIRQALNKGNRAGITLLWSTWEDLPAAISSQIDAISEQWVAEKELPEMGFTLGGMEELKDPDVYLYLAIDTDGKVEAITSWLPSWTGRRVTGWTIDFMRRGDDSMPGIMEFVIASAALHMKELGAEVMSLSGAPLAEKPAEGGIAESEPTVMDRLLGWLGGILEPAYGFTSLFKFKSKFNPRYETIFMAYADPAALPNIGLAIGRAYLPEVSPREYLALVNTLTGRSH